MEGKIGACYSFVDRPIKKIKQQFIQQWTICMAKRVTASLYSQKTFRNFVQRTKSYKFNVILHIILKHSVLRGAEKQLLNSCKKWHRCLSKRQQSSWFLSRRRADPGQDRGREADQWEVCREISGVTPLPQSPSLAKPRPLPLTPQKTPLCLQPTLANHRTQRFFFPLSEKCLRDVGLNNVSYE